MEISSGSNEVSDILMRKKVKRKHLNRRQRKIEPYILIGIEENKRFIR